MVPTTLLVTVAVIAVSILAVVFLYRHYAKRRAERGTQESYANMTPNATNYNIGSTLPEGTIENATSAEAREIIAKEKSTDGTPTLSNEDFYKLKEKIS